MRQLMRALIVITLAEELRIEHSTKKDGIRTEVKGDPEMEGNNEYT